MRVSEVERTKIRGSNIRKCKIDDWEMEDSELEMSKKGGGNETNKSNLFEYYN